MMHDEYIYFFIERAGACKLEEILQNVISVYLWVVVLLLPSLDLSSF